VDFPPQDPILNSLSVYYIHLGGNPSLTPVPPLLTVKNYHSWLRGMERSLISKEHVQVHQWIFVMPHAFNPTFDVWELCNKLVLSWILNLAEPTISQSIIYIEVVFAWKLSNDYFSEAD